MQRQLVEYLICPVCSAPVELLTAETGAEIEGGMLHCRRCGHLTQIRDGIVDALGDAPVTLSAAQLTNYAAPAAWGYERLWRWQSLSLLSGEHFPLQRELRLVAALLDVNRSGLFVDVACSAGLYARSWAQLAPADALLIGVDHSWAMLREARRRARGSARPISFIRAAAQAIPLQSGTVAGVGMGGSLNEIGDQATALAEIRRMLAADGRFVSMNLLEARSEWGRALQQVLSGGGIRFPTSAGWNQMLVAAGLEPWAAWQWHVVAITAARRQKQGAER